MKHLDLTLPTPAANLACDEALLDWCEAELADEVLRFWEAERPFVVLGYANQVRREVHQEACVAHDIPILRRCSGGGTVLQGPGCLNYSLLLNVEKHPELQSITKTNCFIMKQNAVALASLLKKPVRIEGFTDLAVDRLKFSGNAQRRRRRFLLFHGTFLLKLNLALMEQVLRPPSKQPAYRAQRTHSEFLTRLDLNPDAIKAALRARWKATEPLTQIPDAAVAELVATKYSRDEWNLKW